MLHFLPSWIKPPIALVFVSLNTLFWFPFLLLAALLKLFIPLPIVRLVCTKIGIEIASSWIWLNSSLVSLLTKIEWDIRGLDKLEKNEWYLVNSNHQSWADIPIVQKVMLRKIPMLKFFLKQELIWVPVLGICWWALDFPFMKRHTSQQIKQNPALATKDLETTRKACEKFRTTPVSVFNFLEGTRFTQEKHEQQNSPFKHLLKPKAGGAAFVLGSMGEQLKTMLDISIVYPEGQNTMVALCNGSINKIIVDIEKIDIPSELIGKDYANDLEFKSKFQIWINDLWERKDRKLDELKAELGDPNIK